MQSKELFVRSLVLYLPLGGTTVKYTLTAHAHRVTLLYKYIYLYTLAVSDAENTYWCQGIVKPTIDN